MQRFTIRDIENLTGIKAHTLRIWEHRYNFFTPQRKESKHRFYDNEDLKKLLRISFLYHSGWKVSRIAALSHEHVRKEVQQAALAEGQHGYFVSRLIEAAIDFDENAFQHVLNECIGNAGFEKCIVEVCYPYLLKLGLLWSTNHVIPAQEHFSSYMIQNRIIVETEKLPVMNKKPEILLVCPEGEFHELPLLFINYLLRKNGWTALYLGPNIGKEELIRISALPHIAYLYLHLITNFTGFTVDEYLADIGRALPEKKIFISGEGINGVQRNFVNVQLLRTDQQIYDFINRSKDASARD